VQKVHRQVVDIVRLGVPTYTADWVWKSSGVLVPADAEFAALRTRYTRRTVRTRDRNWRAVVRELIASDVTVGPDLVMDSVLSSFYTSVDFGFRKA